MEYALGDIVTTKKAHPCGGKEWEVVRVGVDYKLKCVKCGRIIMVSAEEIKKIVKR